MSRRSFRVGRSKTGLGLFATKPIRKRAFIVAYTGRKITDKESERCEARGARYIFELSKKWAIDGSSHRNLGRYANHSCRGNAEADIRKGNIFIKAMRAIKPGQEITYHYGRDYLLNVLTKRGCKCNACMTRRRRERAEQRERVKRRLKRAAAARKAARATTAKRSKKPAAKRSKARTSR